MSKEELINQLKNAYKQLEEEFKNKGRPNTIEDNNVDYDNCNIYAMRQKIADLEAKLAESEEKCEELQQAISKCTGELPPNVSFDIANDDIRYQIVCNLIDRNQEHRNTIKQLKQQLEEKEKRVKKLNYEAQKYYEDAYCNDFHNQDKISFAVKQLENLQDVMHDKVDDYLYSHNMDNYNEFVTHQGMYSCFEILVKCIDNQITELKKEVK